MPEALSTKMFAWRLFIMGRAHPLEACALFFIFVRRFKIICNVVLAHFSPEPLHRAALQPVMKLVAHWWYFTHNFPFCFGQVAETLEYICSRILCKHLTPEYRSQDGSGTLNYHRFEDRSIILSRTTLIEVYTLSLISVFRAQACVVLYAIISQRKMIPERTTDKCNTSICNT